MDDDEFDKLYDEFYIAKHNYFEKYPEHIQHIGDMMAEYFGAREPCREFIEWLERRKDKE